MIIQLVYILSVSIVKVGMPAGYPIKMTLSVHILYPLSSPSHCMCFVYADMVLLLFPSFFFVHWIVPPPFFFAA